MPHLPTVIRALVLESPQTQIDMKRFRSRVFDCRKVPIKYRRSPFPFRVERRIGARSKKTYLLLRKTHPSNVLSLLHVVSCRPRQGIWSHALRGVVYRDTIRNQRELLTFVAKCRAACCGDIRLVVRPSETTLRRRTRFSPPPYAIIGIEEPYNLTNTAMGPRLLSMIPGTWDPCANPIRLPGGSIHFHRVWCRTSLACLLSTSFVLPLSIRRQLSSRMIFVNGKTHVIHTLGYCTSRKKFVHVKPIQLSHLARFTLCVYQKHAFVVELRKRELMLFDPRNFPIPSALSTAFYVATGYDVSSVQSGYSDQAIEKSCVLAATARMLEGCFWDPIGPLPYRHWIRPELAVLVQRAASISDRRWQSLSVDGRCCQFMHGRSDD